MSTIKAELRRCASLTDAELWATVPRLLREEQENLASFLIHLAEVKRRDLHVLHAYLGLFRYLLRLGLSEWESRARAIAAVAASKYPSVLGLIRSGRLNLTAIAMIGPEELDAMIRRARDILLVALRTMRRLGVSPGSRERLEASAGWSPRVRFPAC